jgi:hypothetical protein
MGTSATVSALIAVAGPLAAPHAAPWILHSAAWAGTAHLPHYGRWAAAIGLSILAIVVIVAAITAARSNRRRR